MKTSFRLIVVLLWLSAAVFVVPAHAEHQAVMSVEDIYSTASARQKELRSVRVTYHVTWEKFMNVPSLTGMAIDPYEHYFVIDDNYRIRSERKPENVQRPQIQIWDGHHHFEQHVPVQAMVLSRRVPSVDVYDRYCNVPLQIPYKDRQQAQLDNGWFYPHSIRPVGSKRVSMYRCLPQQELIDGVWCHVLEYPRRDKLWIDTKRGCVIVKRVRSVDGRTSAAAPVPLTKMECFDFTEAGSGIWVPRKVVTTGYPDPSDPVASFEKPSYRSTVVVSNVAVNDVSDEDFKVSLAEGTAVISDTQELFYVNGNRAMAIDSLFEDVQGVATPRENGLSALLLINLAMILVVCTAVAIRWYRRKRVEVRE